MLHTVTKALTHLIIQQALLLDYWQKDCQQSEYKPTIPSQSNY